MRPLTALEELLDTNLRVLADIQCPKHVRWIVYWEVDHFQFVIQFRRVECRLNLLQAEHAVLVDVRGDKKRFQLLEYCFFLLIRDLLSIRSVAFRRGEDALNHDSDHYVEERERSHPEYAKKEEHQPWVVQDQISDEQFPAIFDSEHLDHCEHAILHKHEVAREVVAHPRKPVCRTFVSGLPVRIVVPNSHCQPSGEY